jgi:hypothetical protein
MYASHALVAQMRRYRIRPSDKTNYVEGYT